MSQLIRFRNINMNNINTFRTILCMFFVFPVQGIHDSDIYHLYKQWYHGDGTYYGATESGLCSLNVPNLPPLTRHVKKLVALNNPQLFGSSACGMCFQVNGTGQGLGHDPIVGSFIVYVKDVCPECHAGSVDLAVNGDGRWKVSIRGVQCPVDGPIEYRLEGSNGYYIKLQVRNERMPATTVDMWQPRGQVWITLQRTRDGFWIFPNDSKIEKPIHLPFKVRLHAPNGHILTDTVHTTSMGFIGVIHGDGVQFPLDPNIPSA